MQVRAYRKEDAPALLELCRRTVREINAVDYSPEQVAAWAPEDADLEEWSRRLEESFTVVVDSDGALEGFADLTAGGHVDHVYVAADRQRQGVGGKLLKRLFLEARRRGLTRVTADVSITAQPFFQRHGFVVESAQTVQHRGVSFRNYRMAATVGGEAGRAAERDDQADEAR